MEEAPSAGATLSVLKVFWPASARLLVVFAACVLSSVVASWPLVIQSSSHFPSASDMPDLQTAIWLPHNTLQQLSMGLSPTEAPGLNYPHGQGLLTVIWNFGVLFLQAPLYTMTHAVQAYTLSLLVLSSLNGLGGFALGWAVGRSSAAGAVGAAALVCSPYIWGELVQGRCEQGLLLWVALTLAGLVGLWRDPTPRGGALAGTCWAISGIFYWFYGYFILFYAFGLLGLAVMQRRWDRVTGLVTSGAVAALVAAPFAAPIAAAVLRADSAYSRATSAPILESILPTQGGFSLRLRDLMWWQHPPAALFAMVPVTLLVGLLAAWLQARTRTLAALGLAGLLFALGPTLQWSANDPVTLSGGVTLTLPLALLQEHVPGFERLWWPYRFLALSITAGAAGLAMLVSLTRRPRLLATALVLMLAAEHRLALSVSSGRLLWDQPESLQVPQLFSDLARDPGEHPLFMLPYRGFLDNGLLWVPYHRQPVSCADGYSEDFIHTPEALHAIARSPARRLLQRLAQDPMWQPGPIDPTTIHSEFRSDGFRYMVLHLSPSATLPRYQPILGAPSYLDEQIAAWDLAVP
jgi:hypothetical protein